MPGLVRATALACVGAALLASGATIAGADACANPKSAAFSGAFANPDDEAARNVVAADVHVGVNARTAVQFDIVSSTTFTTTVGRITFRVPQSSKALVNGKLEIVTGNLQGRTGGFEAAIIGFGPVLDDGSTQCAERVIVTDRDAGAIEPGRSISANTVAVGSAGKDDGKTAFVARVPVQTGLPVSARFTGRFVPGAKYEFFIAASYVVGPAPESGVSAELVALFDGVSPPDGPVEVVVDRVKVQPATRQEACELTSLEHLLVSVRAEQALKVRIDRYELQLRDALDAVANSGSNPGPALRAQDALVAKVRSEIRAELRDSFRAGIEFSKRHLACAKEKLADSGLPAGLMAVAADEIDQAISDDDEAILQSQTENGSIVSEAVRLQGTLLATSTALRFALLDKEQAAQILDPAFVLPDFAAKDPSASLAEFREHVATLAEEYLEKVTAQKEIIGANDRAAAVQAIRAVQQEDCVRQFFDEVEQAYVELHTTVRERLAQVKEAAEEAAQSPEPDPNAPTPAEGRRAEKDMRAIDRSFTGVQKAIDRTERRAVDLYVGETGLDPKGYEKKVAALIRLKQLAIANGDKAHLREIERAIRRLASVQQ